MRKKNGQSRGKGSQRRVRRRRRRTLERPGYRRGEWSRTRCCRKTQVSSLAPPLHHSSPNSHPSESKHSLDRHSSTFKSGEGRGGLHEVRREAEGDSGKDPSEGDEGDERGAGLRTREVSVASGRGHRRRRCRRCAVAAQKLGDLSRRESREGEENENGTNDGASHFDARLRERGEGSKRDVRCVERRKGGKEGERRKARTPKSRPRSSVSSRSSLSFSVRGLADRQRGKRSSFARRRRRRRQDGCE